MSALRSALQRPRALRLHLEADCSTVRVPAAWARRNFADPAAFPGLQRVQ
jgi:hypothetical protein